MSMGSELPPLIPERDEEGFLLKLEAWDKNVAGLLAQGRRQEDLQKITGR